MMPCAYEQGSRKAEAVCIGPALRKVAQRVSSRPRPHRQHSRTGESSPQLPYGCAFEQGFELGLPSFNIFFFYLRPFQFY